MGHPTFQWATLHFNGPPYISMLQGRIDSFANLGTWPRQAADSPSAVILNLNAVEGKNLCISMGGSSSVRVVAVGTSGANTAIQTVVLTVNITR